eukprot:12895443-Prorocentrum_lima.AAC.1
MRSTDRDPNGLGANDRGAYHEFIGEFGSNENCSVCKNKIKHYSKQGQTVSLLRSRLLGAYTMRLCCDQGHP